MSEVEVTRRYVDRLVEYHRGPVDVEITIEAHCVLELGSVVAEEKS